MPRTTVQTTDRSMDVLDKGYSSVSEMVRDLSDPDFADEFDKFQSDRKLANCLTVIRCAKEVDQADLANRMGCSQSKVSRMEASADVDLNFGDVLKYAIALKQSVHIEFSPSRKTEADHPAARPDSDREG